MRDLYKNKMECALRNKSKDIMLMVGHYHSGNRVDILDIRKECEDFKLMIFAQEQYKLVNRSDVEWAIQSSIDFDIDPQVTRDLSLVMTVINHAKSANKTKLRGVKWIKTD